MPLIEWKDDMSVGIDEFDSHHKRLIQLINKLNDSIMSGDSYTVSSEVLAEVANYTLYHFFAEEEAMRKYSYPEYDSHRKEHIDLTEKTLGLLQESYNSKESIGPEVLAFLKEWLRHHILETDKQYSPFLNARGLF
ncbi:MAG: hemerythrin family protein [Nitrospirae bacterium]|nr:hemerythrin family protein [Nitrospirota bacterium]